MVTILVQPKNPVVTDPDARTIQVDSNHGFTPQDEQREQVALRAGAMLKAGYH